MRTAVGKLRERGDRVTKQKSVLFNNLNIVFFLIEEEAAKVTGGRSVV